MNGGRERHVDPPAVLRVESPAQLWVLQQGTASLFVLRDVDGTHGPRRFVATLRSGDPVFGLPAEQGARCTFLIAPTERTALIEHSMEELFAPGLPAWRALLDRWRTLTGPFLGEELPAIDPADTGGELGRIHAAFHSRIAALDHREHQDETEELASRASIADAVTGQLFDQLASTVREAPRPVSTGGGSPLALAVAEIAAVIGLQVTLPPPAESLRNADEELAAICHASRVRTRRVLLRDRWWHREQGPLLAFTLDGNRPVALLPDGPRRYDLFDPATGERRRVDAAAAATLAPMARMFYPRLPDGRVTPARLVKFAFTRWRRDFAIALLCGVGVTLLNMLWPAAIGLVVDSAVPDADRALLVQIALGLFAAAAGRALFELAQSVALLRLQTAANMRAEPAIWDRVLNLRPGTLREFPAGDLYSRIGVVRAVNDRVGDVTLRTLFTGIISLLNVVAMLLISPALTLVAVVVAIAVAAVMMAAGIATVRLAPKLQAKDGETYGLTVQLINAVSKLQVAGAEARAFAQWGRGYAERQTLVRDLQRISDRVTLMDSVLPTAATALLFGLAGFLLTSGNSPFSAGTFLAFNALFGTFIGAVGSLAGATIEVLNIGALWKRARPLLDATPEVDSRKTHPGRLRGAVELDRVRFRYRPDGPLTLTDVSIQANPGEFIALVGPSGCGKSTIFRLILGFDTPESGAVLHDGQDLSGLDVHAVRRQLGVVLQSSRLMTGSIFENVAAGTPIGLGDALEALKKAGLEEDVSAWPMGVHTVVSEGGSNISGGQRQRLLIARALVRTPAVLLFDEATSALDNTSQAIVTRSLNALKVTRVVIAHRLTTIRQADRIYVIDAGRVVQQGTFAALMQEEGLFSRLMRRQL